MLRGLCQYVILGHSERRQYFGELTTLVNRKTLAAFAHDLRPIVCVGESLEDRDAGLTERVLTAQVRGSLAGLEAARLGELVVAYEPMWAIGSGRAASPQDAADAAALIRALLAEQYGAVAAAARAHPVWRQRHGGQRRRLRRAECRRWGAGRRRQPHARIRRDRARHGADEGTLAVRAVGDLPRGNVIVPNAVARGGCALSALPTSVCASPGRRTCPPGRRPPSRSSS